jgi:hypothetical protein
METQVYDVVLNAFFELREFDSDALNQPRILGRLGYRGGDGGRGDMRGVLLQTSLLAEFRYD